MNNISLNFSETLTKGFLNYINFIFGFGKKKKEKHEEKEVKKQVSLNKDIVLTSPIKGEIIQLDKLGDEAFASGALGKGVGFNPTVGKVYSPINGVISTIFPTKHAVTILSDEGVEVLIHIGIDTVKLEGKFFTSHVSDGDKIKKGQLLVEFDIDGIKKEGYSLETPMVITNSDNYNEIKIIEKQQINELEDLIVVK